jgi:anti-sigma factor RsiW
MKCAECQDHLLTVYADNELSAGQRAAVDGHLAACAACREFDTQVQANTIHPFADLPNAAVPASVWQGIKRNLEQSGRPAPAAASWWQRFLLPRAAVVAVPAVVFGIALFWVAPYRQGTVAPAPVMETAAVENDEDYFSYLYEDEEMPVEDGSPDAEDAWAAL